jgi:hypothetical protein
MKFGDTMLMRKFRHYFGDDQFVEYKIEDKNRVGVFLFLGTQPIDGSKELDLLKAMYDLGFVPDKDIKLSYSKEKELRGHGL